MTPTNGNGLGAINTQPAETSKQNTVKRKFTRKSTATAAQYERVIDMLRAGEKNTLEFRRAGIMAPAARIKELNDHHGFYIPTIALITIYDEWGFGHKNIAVYELIDDPWKDRNLTRELVANG